MLGKAKLGGNPSSPPPSPSPSPAATPGAEESKRSDFFSVPDALIKGTTMTKVSEKKQKRVLFQLDPDEGRISYKSKKIGVVQLETVKEIRTGALARYYLNQFSLPPSSEERWITVIYILEGTYKTLHMLADTRDDFVMWEAALRKLFTVRLGLMKGLGNGQVRGQVWERQYWKGADSGGDEKLSFEEVEKLCQRLNAAVPTRDLKELFNKLDSGNKGYLDFKDFQAFVKILKRRPDIELIYNDIVESNGGKFDFAAFVKFMRHTQYSNMTYDELKDMFAKYRTTSTQEQSSDSQATPPSNDEPPPTAPEGIFTRENFSSFLLSSDNSVFSEKTDEVWQDMTRPISEYFISSSHNTYLVGHQLVGVSTIEGYIRALLHSCRSVELDIYDGDKEPVVFHGRTFTSEVTLRDICHAISKYAFVSSPYPLLISAEVHCGLKQQDMLVDIMVEAFGDALVRAPVEGRPKIAQLPSPDDLKGKFLLKAKNLYVVAQLEALRTQKATPSKKQPQALDADPSSSESSDSGEDMLTNIGGEIKNGIGELKQKWRHVRGKESTAVEAAGTQGDKPSKPQPKPKVKMSFALASLLVYTVGVKCRGLGKEHGYAPEHIFSLSENAANKLMKVNGTMGELVKHTKDHMVRIYPKGTRVDSTNYRPHRFWAAGAQVVAINWQTFDLGYMMNQAMFQRNGRAGLVLKPDALRGNQELLSQRSTHILEVTIISAQQLPRLRDSMGHEIVEKSVVDPLVQVSVHIPDWSHSPFVNASSSPDSPPPGGTTLLSRTVTQRTRAVKNNGFNPVWRETLRLPFDVVGGPGMREVIFVQFSVYEDDNDDDDDEPIAVYCTPLACMEQGFRHLPLHDSQLSQYLFSTLFVQIKILDA